MSRRVLLTSLLIALLLGLLVLAPGFPPVRNALLKRATSFLTQAGVELDYGGAAGNAWRRVALTDVSLEGHGSTATVDELELSYHLPSLLGGELPLDVTARGVRGDLDLDVIERLVAEAAAEPGGAGVGIRVVLREIHLADVELRAENAPFTLPDATLSDIEVTPEPGGLQLGARVTTGHGQVAAEGRLALPSFDFTGTITHADVSVAQRWWPGAIGGSASGPFTIRRGQVNADLRVEGATIEQSGATVTGIGGTATLRYPRITADLTGTALGGPLSAKGTVDIAATRYDVNAVASPSLADAGAWLAEFLGLDELPVAAEGAAVIDASVSGWREPVVRATAAGAGSLAGLPLEDLDVGFNLSAGGAMRGGLSARLAGGPISATIAPGPVGERLIVNASSLDLASLEVAGFAVGGVLQGLRAQVDLDGAPSGTLLATWAGEALSLPATLEVDGRLDQDGLQAFFTALADTGAAAPLSATGAVVFDLEQQRLDAGLSVADLVVPGVSRPLRLGLSARGPLADLTIGVAVENERPVLLDLALLQPGGVLAASEPIDLRGSATGRLAGGAVEGISGRFGPLTVTGGASLEAATAQLSVTLDPVTVRGGAAGAASAGGLDVAEGDADAPAADAPAPEAALAPAAAPAPPLAATVAIPSGTLRYADRRLTLQARAVVQDARAGPALVEVGELDISAALAFAAGGAASERAGDADTSARNEGADTAPSPASPGSAAATWSLAVTAPGERVAFHLDSSGDPFQLAFAQLPVHLTAAGRPAFVSGALTPTPSGGLALDAQVAPGSNVGGLRLANGAALVGVVDTARDQLRLAGTIGDLPVVTTVDWSAPEVAVAGTAGALGFGLTPATGAWRLAGNAALAPLLSELGVTGPEASFAGSLDYSAELGFGGSARLSVVRPVPVTLDLTGTDERLDLALTGELGGVPLEGAGAIEGPLLESFFGAIGAGGAGAPGLLVDLGPLRDVTVDMRGVRGAGEVPATSFGPVSVGPVPWSLELDWATTSGFLETAGEHLQLELADGLIHTSGSLAADLTYAGAGYRLSVWPGAAAGAAVTVAAPAELPLGGALVATSGGAPLATFGGTAQDLAFRLDAALAEVAAALPEDYRPTGVLSAAGRVDLLSGPAYEGTLTLSPASAPAAPADQPGDAAPSEDIHATFSGVGARFELAVDGAGLAVQHVPGEDGAGGTGGAQAGTGGAGRLTLNADQVDVSRFLPPAASGSVNGSLSYGASGWGGALALALQADAPAAPGAAGAPLLVADASLVGNGASLDLALTAAAPAQSRLTASGTLLPAPSLSGSFGLLGEEVSGEFTWSDGLEALITSREQHLPEVGTLPAQSAVLRYDLGTGAVTLAGADPASSSVIDLRLLGGALEGRLALPFELRGQSAALTASVGGTLGDPAVSAAIALESGAPAEATADPAGADLAISNPIATLDGSLQGGAAVNVQLTPGELAALLPEAASAVGALIAGDATATATVRPSGAWEATARAPLAAGEPSLELQLIAAGQGAAYEGRAVLQAGAPGGAAGGAPDGATAGTASEIAHATVTGTGGDAAAELDLGAVAWGRLGDALGVPLDIEGGGRLALATAPLSAALALDLTGHVGENSVRLRGAAPDDFTLSFDGPDGHLEGRLAWASTPAGGGSAALTGELLGRPVELRLDVDDGLASGNLDLEAAGARVSARLTTPPAAPGAPTTRAVTLRAEVPTGSWAPVGGVASAAITLDGAEATLDALTAELHGLLGDTAGAAAGAADGVTLTLAGALTPELRLEGTAASPRLPEPLTLQLDDDTGLTARLGWRNLAATAALAGSEGLRLSVSGGADGGDIAALLAGSGDLVPAGAVGQLEALAPSLALDLAWSAAGGWAGELEVRARAPWAAKPSDLLLTATGAADGTLQVEAAATVEGGVAELSLQLAREPWSNAALAGRLELDLPASVFGVVVEPELRLRSQATIGGTLVSPTLSGPVALAGPVSAEGVVGYADGALELSLSGRELVAVASLGPEGLTAEGQLRDLALGAWLPQLPDGTLALSMRLAGSQVSISDIALRAPGSLVSGGATLNLAGADAERPGPSVSAALDASVNLADLALGGVELAGTVRGPLVVNAADLTDLGSATVIANLAAVRVGVPSLGGSVSGNLAVGGRLGDPAINAQLLGDGNVSGLLTVDARPAAGAYSLISSLGVGQFGTDLRLEMGEGFARAAGAVRYGEAIVLVSNGPATGARTSPATAPAGGASGAANDLLLTGAGRLAGLSARVSGGLNRAEVGGSLDQLGAGLQGRLDLVLDSEAQTWLVGAVDDAAVAGVQLGRLTITAGAFGAPIDLAGPAVRAAFDPATVGWTLAADELALSGAGAAPILSLQAHGTGATLALDATLSGPDVDLALALTHGDAVTLALSGTAYGGDVALEGARRADTGEWEGGGRYSGGSLMGFTLAAEATLQGSDLIPQAVLSTRAEDGVTIQGNASVSALGVTVDQLVRGGPLEQAVRLQGRLLPASDLTLSTLDLAPGAALTAAAAGRATTSSVRLTDTAARGPNDPAALRATGAFVLPFGPARVEVAGADGPPQVDVSLLGLPGWHAGTELAATDLLALAQGVVSGGLTLHGREALSGELRLDPAGPSLELSGFGLEFAGLSASATGVIGLGGADVTGALTVRTDLPVAEREEGYVFPWRLTGAEGVWRLSSSGPHGEFAVNYDDSGGASALSLSADLTLSEGRIVGQLGLEPTGLVGTLSLTDVRLLSPAIGAFTLGAEATVADGRIGGQSTLANEAGRVTISGNWGLGGLLPAALAPGAPEGGRLEARLRTLELSRVPLLQEHVPELHGEVSGVAQLRDGFLLGQLVAAEIGVADLTTPLQLSFNGPLADLSLELQLRGALGRATFAAGELAGMFRLERFPLNLLSAAVVGQSDFTADLTGVMRFDGPLARPAEGYLRLATEEIRLERMGVTTVGNVTVTFDEGALLVEQAAFEGRGAWRAEGVLRPDLYDFRLEAQQADFTPLLGLVPSFARLGVGAAGSFDLSVSGSAADPHVSLTSPELEVAVAGTRYRLEGTEVSLEGVTLSTKTRVLGLRPVTGLLDVEGGAFLSLFPFSLTNTELALSGDLQLAGFGTITGLTGALRQEPDGTPTISATGTMGSQPLTVAGTLVPLDVRATGSGVTVALPSLLIDRAVVDADVRLRTEEGGVALGGGIVADEVVLDPAARGRAQTPAATPAQPAAPAANELLPEIEPPPPPAAEQAPASGLAALRFDGLSLRAPGRVTLETSVGSFEAALDLTLTGTGAEPRLSGSAAGLRGNLRFGGREFTIDRAVATFAPNRGVFPELDVAAHAEFEKSRVLAAAPNVSFAAPREGGTFLVQLGFTGPVEPAEVGGFRFDIRPILTSNALIEIEGQTQGASAARPFTEAELMSLVTLGRFELNADLIGAGGLGEAVAQGALDTAVDLLVVSGLESALREALGLDVVEIRTSSISSLLDEGGQPFGVSLRVGGYLNPELFASYRIGTYDGGDPNFSLTNEVLLRYALGPIDLDLIGRVDFPMAGTLESPRPELGVLLGYQFSPLLGIDAGVTLGTASSKLEFGVTIRW